MNNFIPIELYPGMRPFRADESNIFFGREALVDQTAVRLMREHCITVAGPSGSGKSSFIRAGLLPRLGQTTNSTANSRWETAAIRLSSEPFKTLIEALGEGPSDFEWSSGLQGDHERLRQQFSRLLREISASDRPHLLLIVDQFEDIFRYYWSSPSSRLQIELFIAALRDISAGLAPQLHIVLVIRADFLGDCYVFPGLTELVNESLLLIPPLTREQRAEAIVRPLATVGASVAREVVDRIIADTAEPARDSLTLMQHVLSRMWFREREPTLQHHKGQDSPPIRLTMTTYEAVGEAAHALELHAEEVYSALDDKAQQTAECMFRLLTDTQDGRTVRRPATIGNIASAANTSLDDVRAVVQAFHQSGFLVRSWEADSLVEIVHEMLIARWHRLARWVAEEAELAQKYVRLSELARSHRDGRASLLRDTDLNSALAWVKQLRPSAQWAARYNADFDLTMSYLQSSRIQSSRGSEKDKRKEGLFICYRRDDSAGDARNVSEALKKRFSSVEVFMDVDSIHPGSDFESELDKALQSCSVVLVLIGPHWLEVDEEGRRRLDNSSDYVRREIRQAISRDNLLVIPLLLGRAMMPNEDVLPPDIRRLTKHQSVPLRYDTYKADLQGLLMTLSKLAEMSGLTSRVAAILIRALRWRG